MNETSLKQRRDMAILIFTMLVFGTVGILRRYIPLSSAVIAFTRGAVGALYLALRQICRRRPLIASLSRKSLGLLIVTGMLMGLNWMVLFEAYNYTTVSCATLLYYMQPVLLMLGCALVFKERLTLKNIFLAACGFFGMVLVSGILSDGLPDAGQRKGMVLAFLAAVLYAAIVMINKRMDQADPYEKTLVQLASAAVVMIPYLLLTEDLSAVSFDPKGWALLLLLGIFHTGFTYSLYFGCIGSISSHTIAVFSYVDPITTLILAAILLNESMDAAGIAGSVLIIGSALLNQVQLRRE
ncbi:MAG: EamA family transporter [Firmicutes bacterium]|nr:EamA family transporter [Bacillota bacterium]